MALDYTVKGPDGSEGIVDSEYVADQLRAQGENVTAVSPDGRMLTMVDNTGEFQIPVDQALSLNGFQVQQAIPSNADYSMANPEFRAAVSLLPNDGSKEMFLKDVYRGRGIQDPQIMGNGRDWFVYDPESENFYGVTNNPDWDRTDITEGLAEIPGVIGQAAGAIGGIPGGIPGIAAGAAAGGMAARGLTRGAVAGMDELANDGSFGRALMSDPTALAKTMGAEAGLDAGAAAIGPVLGKTVGPAAKRVMETGPVSQVAKGLGWAGENIGRGISKSAQFVDESPLAKEISSFAIPGAGDAVGLGFVGQLPGMTLRGGTNAMGKLGRSKLMQRYAPGAGNKMASLSDDLLRPRSTPTNTSTAMTEGAEQMASAMRGEAYERPIAGTSESILGNLGEKLGSMAGNSKAYREAIYRYGRQAGLGAEEAMSMARRTKPGDAARYADDILSTPGVRNTKQVAQTMARPDTWGQAGAKLGRGTQTIENIGDVAYKTGMGVTGGVLKAGKRAGQAGSYAGLGTKLAGTVASPLENRMYFRYGAEEALSPYYERSPWQKSQSMDKMYMAQGN